MVLGLPFLWRGCDTFDHALNSVKLHLTANRIRPCFEQGSVTLVMRRNADDHSAAFCLAQFANKFIALAVIKVIIDEQHVKRGTGQRLTSSRQTRCDTYRVLR